MVAIPIRKIKIKLAFIGSLKFCVLFSCCHKHNDQKQLRKKKRAYFILQLYIPSLREADAGNQGRILNQKLQSHAAYWLVPRFTFCYLSYKTPEPLPKKGTAYSGLGLPTPMSNHKRIFIDTPTDQSDGSNLLSIGVPSSQRCQVDHLIKIRHYN